MNSTANYYCRGWRRLMIVSGLFLLSLLISRPASAVTDRVFISVNGDTSVTSLVQGDTVRWGANCEIGGALTWQIWLDLNSNSVIDTLTDKLIAEFVTTDGDTLSEEGPGDTNPIPDGWYVSPLMILGVAPSSYIFRAMNNSDYSSAWRQIECNPLLTPPNMFRGQVTIQGHPAPDPTHLRNIWVEASPQHDGSQVWSGLTNDSGFFEINISDAGTNMEFQIWSEELSGYVTPGRQTRTASGIVGGIDFYYSAPTDSLFGQIRDQSNALIQRPIDMHCYPEFPGPDSKDITATDGNYAIYFGPSEYGRWNVNFSPESLVPEYLFPMGYNFDNSVNHSQQHDFTCFASDTVMYARITEAGGNPTHRYIVFAQSNSLQIGTGVISDTGVLNIATLHVSSLDQSSWHVSISNGDDRYPIPRGYVLDESQTWNRHPGDTVALNFVFGNMVRDTLTADPGDSPIIWNNTSVSLSNQNHFYNGQVDGNGVFNIYADTGTYWMGVYSPGYLANPSSRTVNITGDTTGGLGFILNNAHCRINGTLVNVPLPLGNNVSIFAHTGEQNAGYTAMADVDSLTGAFMFNLCDGNWTIDPPFIPNLFPPNPAELDISEYPDSIRSLSLVYTPQSEIGEPQSGIPDRFTLAQNYPNPFNPVTTIEFSLPSRSSVTIEVINLLGQTVRTLVQREYAPGAYRVDWNGVDDAGNVVATGVYMYRLKTGEFIQSRKMLLLK